jgi:uncharacterized protein (TIGR02611 family)
MLMKKRIRKTLVSIVGFIVLIAGIIMIPYPGPGWLVVFAALGILSMEYAWAKRALNFGKRKYDSWNAWTARQGTGLKVSLFIATTVVVVLTLWLLNTYGIINHVLHLGWNRVDSPLPVFHQ